MHMTHAKFSIHKIERIKCVKFKSALYCIRCQMKNCQTLSTPPLSLFCFFHTTLPPTTTHICITYMEIEKGDVLIQMLTSRMAD